jgi:Ni/Fe-hydrogenase 1 B-type cytochrome subunit
MKRSSRLQTEAGTWRVYVWEWPVRMAHWLMVLSLILLSVTGYYIYRPFLISTGGYVMAIMRFTHVVSGFVFLVAILLRICWMFMGNQWARWDQFVPTNRGRLTNLAQTAKFYSFLRWRPIPTIGHNALAGAAYTVVYALALIEIITGLALYSHILGSKFWAALTGWPLRLIDIQYVREIHFLVMFAFWMFLLHHIYSSVLISSEERAGVMESIFSGYKFVSQNDLQRESVELPQAQKKRAGRRTEQVSTKTPG